MANQAIGVNHETLRWAFAVMSENTRLKSELAIVRAEAYEQSQELLELRSEYEDLQRELDNLQRTILESEEAHAARPSQPEPLESYVEGISRVSDDEHDDLTAIDGIDRVTADLLSALGIVRFEQLAEMPRSGWDWLEQFVPALRHKDERYRWATHARLLANNPGAYEDALAEVG